jgi:hypothetical protein
MNCANCNEDIYWNHDEKGWRHLGDYYKCKILGGYFAEPKIDEPKKSKINPLKKMLKVFGKYDIYETEDGLNITGHSPNPNMMVDKGCYSGKWRQNVQNLPD